jgi:hypothetical protein
MWRALGRPAGRSYNVRTMFLEKERLARPGQEMGCASWFLRTMPLLPGRATPEIQPFSRIIGEKLREARFVYALTDSRIYSYIQFIFFIAWKIINFILLSVFSVVSARENCFFYARLIP